MLMFPVLCCSWCFAVLGCSVGGVALRLLDGIVTSVVALRVGFLLWSRFGEICSLPSAFIVHRRSLSCLCNCLNPNYRFRADVGCSGFAGAPSFPASLALLFWPFIGFDSFALVSATTSSAVRVWVFDSKLVSTFWVCGYCFYLCVWARRFRGFPVFICCFSLHVTRPGHPFPYRSGLVVQFFGFCRGCVVVCVTSLAFAP